jgi:hypothetical protein
MWLASAAPNPQVRAIASFKLGKLAARNWPATDDAGRAQYEMIAGNIKRFLNRPAEPSKMIPVPDAPPGAPIGDEGMDWLATPKW